MSERHQTVSAKVRTEYQSAGAGCLLQLLGLGIVWVFPIGTVLGIVLFLGGSMASRRFVCSNCRNRLTDRQVKVCPTCGATF